MYWNIDQVLSYNALFNFIMGERGNGKSYGTKLKAIQRYLKTGKKFGYIRRYDEELERSASTFFNDVGKAFPDSVFSYKSREFKMNGEVIGNAFVLSTAGKLKSMSYPDIDFLIFDEFILDPANYFQRYLPDEVNTFLNLYETIARDRNVICFFLANRLSDVNPYSLYFRLEQPKNAKGISCKNDILVQYCNSVEYREHKKNTRFGKIIGSTDYGKYAIENESLRDSCDFVVDPPNDAVYTFTLKTFTCDLGVYYSKGDKHMYVSLKVDPSHPIVLTTESILHGKGCTLVTSKNQSVLFRMLVEGYKMGTVGFDSMKSKSIILETMRGMMR